MLKPKRETFMIVTSAPEDSGLRTGDHVISINGEPIRASEQRKFLHSKMANALETGELTIEVEVITLLVCVFEVKFLFV